MGDFLTLKTTNMKKILIYITITDIDLFCKLKKKIKKNKIIFPILQNQ